MSLVELFFFWRKKVDKPTSEHRAELTTWQVFLSSREEISQPEIEPQTSSFRFGFLSTIIQQFRVISSLVGLGSTGISTDYAQNYPKDTASHILHTLCRSGHVNLVITYNRAQVHQVFGRSFSESANFHVQGVWHVFHRETVTCFYVELTGKGVAAIQPVIVSALFVFCGIQCHVVHYWLDVPT